MKCNDIVRYKSNLGKVVKDDKGNYRFHPLNHGRYYYEDLEIITKDDVQTTYDEEKIYFIENEFNWGVVIKTHCISNFQIIECIRENKESYHVYIDFKDCCKSANSLDKALIIAICQKYEGCNERLSNYVCRILFNQTEEN